MKAGAEGKGIWGLSRTVRLVVARDLPLLALHELFTQAHGQTQPRHIDDAVNMQLNSVDKGPKGF